MSVHDKGVASETGTRARRASRKKATQPVDDLPQDISEAETAPETETQAAMNELREEVAAEPMRAETDMYNPDTRGLSTEVLIHLALETVVIDVTRAIVNSYAKDGWQLIAVTPVTPKHRVPGGVQYSFVRPL